MGKEKDPLGHLAAFLSDHKTQFMSDGKGNFSLRPVPTQTPAELPEDLQRKLDEVVGVDAAAP